MGLRDWYNKFVRRKEAYSNAEDEQRMIERLEQKKLSANERELNKFLEKDREQKIKEMLEQYRNREKEEVWHGTTALDAPNIIANQKNLFSHQQNMFGWKSNNVKGKSMYFK